MLMSVEQFDRAVASLDGYWGVIACFGGNPTMHPQFDEICKIMRARVPYEQRGIWTNDLRGKGALCRVTFNPKHSNINVHTKSEAYAEFERDWPEAIEARREHTLAGLTTDSLHSSPWVAMRDVMTDESEMYKLIGDCDINKNWSALLGVFRGELRAWFCEIAAHQAMLHQDNPDWAGTGRPIQDTGLPADPGWWKRPMRDFEDQVRTHCVNCGVPLRRPGQLAIGGEKEEYSKTHEFIMKPKAKGRPTELVTIGGPVWRGERPSTEYLGGVTPGYRPQ